MKSRIAKTIQSLVCCMAVCFGTSISNADTIYSESFDGAGGEQSLNGSAEDFAGELWVTNGFATDDGNLFVGQAEGSATLPFAPVVGVVYTLTMDVTTASDRWFGIGFSQFASTGEFNRPQDRFPQA